MKHTLAYAIVIGLVIGAIFGLGLGAANDSALAGISIGALAGVFLRLYNRMKRKRATKCNCCPVRRRFSTPAA